jgi:molybdenum cofactor cytidylyltransferase
VTTLAAVLAAGVGSRFGGPKLHAPFRGRPLLVWAVEAVLGAGLDEVAVVTGGEELGDIVPEAVTVVPNPAWATGQASSVRAAVGHARQRGHDAVVVGLGDSPLVPTEAWRAVAEAPGPLVTATYDGRRSPPVRLGQEVWDLLPTTGDGGARVLMAERPDLVSEVPCPGDPSDVDTREDLERWS